MKAIAAAFNMKGGDTVQTVLSMLKVLSYGRFDTLTVATPKNVEVAKSLEQLSQCRFESPITLGHVFLKVLAHDEPQPIQTRGTTLIFDGRIYHPHLEIADIKFVEQKLRTNDKVEETAEALIKDLDGGFAFALVENEKLVAGRDALGLYPLYYGEKNSLFALASERKALWKIGLNETHVFPPGHVLVVNKGGLTLKPVKVPQGIFRQESMEDAIKKLEQFLTQSIAERTAGLGKIAVAFSGGLDSSLTALLAKKVGVKVHLVHVSLENQRETLQAEEAANLLELPFHKYLYSEGDVEQVLSKVLQCVEIPDPLKISIGIPLYWAAERAAELGFKVMLTGQGADELFGGYKRYLTVSSRFGSDFAEKVMANDVLKLHEDAFEMDFKICSFHGVELRLPFASYPLVEFALSLPLTLKIASTNDHLRKFVLRKTAEKLGLPKRIAYKPKKAVQYSTGVDKALKNLARQKRITLKSLLQKIFHNLWQKHWNE